MNLYLGQVTCFVALLTTIFASVHAADSELPIAKHVFEYDVSIGYLDAGVLTLELEQFSDKYEILGRFKSSRALSKYYTWNGLFAAKGHMQDRVQRTDGYFVRSEGSDEHFKMVVLSKVDVRIIEGRDKDLETLPHPGGIDLISGLFFNPSCYQGQLLHDGEDAYPVKLVKTKATKLASSDRYVSGNARECIYRLSDRKGRKRKIYVTQAEERNVMVAAKIRIGVSWFPDPTFALRRQYSAN